MDTGWMNSCGGSGWARYYHFLVDGVGQVFEKIDSKSEGSASVIHVYCHLATEQWLQQRMLRFFLSTAVGGVAQW